MTENTKIQLMLGKIESSYGVDPTPTGPSNAALIADFKVVPLDQQEVERPFALAGFDSEASIPYGSQVKMTFSSDVAPSSVGADTPPPCGVLLRACRHQETIVAATSVAYTPIATGMESATLYGYIGATLHKLIGGRGTVVLDGSGAEPRWNWSFTGLYSDPADGALPTPTYPGQLQPRPMNKANTDFTLNTVALVLHQMTFDAGVKTIYRDKPNYEAVDVDDAQPMGSIKVHKPALSSFNAFTIAGNKATPPTLIPMAFTHKFGGGRNVALAVPKLQIQKPDYDADGNIRLVSMSHTVRRNPAGAGYSITFT